MKMKFHTDVELNMLKLYFSQAKAGGAYSLLVQVVDSSAVIFQQHYPLHTYNQLTYA
jgi:hypothetical protein